MRHLRTLILLWYVCTGMLAAGQTAVGQWRDWASMGQINHVENARGRIYAAGNLGIFYYDKTTENINTLYKSDGLSDAGIACMAYDDESDYLVIGYNNGNVDLVHKKNIYNISDIRRSDLVSNKNLYNITFHDQKAYLSCGFGIVVIDLERKEIKESYYLGNDGRYAPVYDVIFLNNKIIAATDAGVLTADADDEFLNIVDRWTADNTLLSSLRVSQLAELDGHLVALTLNESQKSLYKEEDGQFYEWLSGDISHIRNAAGQLIICYADRIEITGNDNDENINTVDWFTPTGGDAILDENGQIWTGHEWAGLVKISKDRSNARWYRPECPSSDHAYKFTAYKDRMLVCPGGKTSTYANSGIAGTVMTYRNKAWLEPNNNGFEYRDVLDAAVNPKDTSEILASAWGYGIVRIVNGKVTEIYNETNTSGILTPYSLGSYTTLRTGAVAFDRQGNAWMTNSLVADGLVCRTKEGIWKSFNIGSMTNGSEVDKILIDDRTGYIWMMGRANKLYVHDGESKMAYVSPNTGSKLSTNAVNCMELDLDGEIWLGTDKGIKVIYNTSSVFQNGGHGEQAPTTCNNIIMSEEFDEYLMHYENITCMAVDGANRKWVGTNSGGLYLISANGLEQIEHFTSKNSPLFSDKIVCVEVQPQTGEVFIGTDVGIQVFRGTATDGAKFIDKSSIHTFPNPVKPDYDGPIAIKGFSTNAIVHITDVAGHVVYSTTANGGQAIWYARTNNGERVGSGVYYVFASDSTGEMKAVAKVLIVKGN